MAAAAAEVDLAVEAAVSTEAVGAAPVLAAAVSTAAIIPLIIHTITVLSTADGTSAVGTPVGTITAVAVASVR